MIASLLAHQGGWDEIALVAGPLAVFAAALWLANRRANTKLAAMNDADTADEPADDPETEEAG